MMEFILRNCWHHYKTTGLNLITPVYKDVATFKMVLFAVVVDDLMRAFDNNFVQSNNEIIIFPSALQKSC